MQRDIPGKHNHQDPDDVRPAYDSEIEPVAEAIVAPQRDCDSKQRNGEHIGSKLQRPTLGDAGLRQSQYVDLPGDADMEGAPDGAEGCACSKVGNAEQV